MRVLRGHAAALSSTAFDAAPRALTIGNFDGVHRGHQALLAQVKAAAQRLGLPCAVLTFEPHPREHFAQRSASAMPARITPLRDKLAALAACGVDEAWVLRFDDALAALTPEAFVQRVLRQRLGARHVAVGDDFRFGARRAGDFARLQALGAASGFAVERLQTQTWAGERISSSAVRAALAAGDMARAAQLLGRPYRLSGHVLHGAKLGRQLGFRTLNLRFGEHRRLALQPAAMGIFVAEVRGLAPTPLPAVASLGVRPAVEAAGRVRLETHVLRWPPTLGADAGYGRCIEVGLLHKLHDERPYPSLEALRQGIADDTEAARAWWRERGADV